MSMITALTLCIVAAVTDGDSIRCTDRTRLRLADIDAPEMSHCRPGRNCAPGDPVASRENLRWLAGDRVHYRIVDGDRCKAGFQATDHYGRRVVKVYVDGVDLGEEQVRGGFAVRWRCGR
jgi:micrococcal nuclease